MNRCCYLFGNLLKKNLCITQRHNLYNSTNRNSSFIIQSKIPIPKQDYSVDSNISRSNWFITKLCREGNISHARQLFDEMSDRDVVSWTAMLSGYIRCGMIQEARNIFDRENADKNVVTWTAMLSGYIRFNNIKEAEQLFNQMPCKNIISWNTMICGYAQNGRVDSALDLFNRMAHKNVVSWNTIITALSQCGRIDEAMKLFELMPEKNVISWTCMVTGLSKNGKIDDARAVFELMPDRNVVSWNAMITGYAQNLRLDEAFDLFKRMPMRDLHSWNTMITGFIRNGDLARARELFDDMPRKNVVSWTAMVTGYVQDGNNEEALKIFSKMLAFDDVKVKPNEGTFVSVLGACSNLAGLSEGRQVHQRIIKTVYQNNTFVVSAVLNMYSKCGSLGHARKIFDNEMVNHRDLISWNSMIAAYAHHGRGYDAINLFEKMRDLGFEPNDVTYVGLLSACSHAGLVEEGINYFNTLTKDKSISMREDHYSCLVDLCVRGGRVKEAFDLITRLEKNASASIWGALLGGCNLHKHTDIAKVAAKKMIELEPQNAGTYLSLSNMYASSGKWKEASRIRMKMKEDGFKKQPGCSWIEVGNRVHVFVVGQKSYSLLHHLHFNMKKVDNDFFVD